MGKGSYLSGPANPPPPMRPSFRRVRALAVGSIALCCAVSFLYAFRLYTNADPDAELYRTVFYPQLPLHSGLSDPPLGFYKDRIQNPFAGSDRLVDDGHHQLSEDGPLSATDSMHNPLAGSSSHADSSSEQPKDSTEVSKTASSSSSSSSTSTSTSSTSTPSIPPVSGTPITITEDHHSGSTGKSPSNPDGLTTTVVVGRTDSGYNGTQWIHDDLRDVTSAAIYVVDDPEAPLHLDRNKGREAMVYMKYIMEHYDTLSDVTVFFHSGRTAWHNNVLANKDGAVMINNLRRQHVLEEGYFNLRCELYPGCPNWVLWNATREENKARHPERFNDLFSAAVWDELFPNRTHDPVYLAEACCSQFAVSRDRIRSRPLADYIRIHDFLAASRIADGYIGRIMEYVWQFLWLDKDVHCPSMVDCYCRGYGTCLQGEDATALTDWNDAKVQEDQLLEELGHYDAEHCNGIDDVQERRECKKENPVQPKLGECRRKAGTLMEQRLRKYIMKDA